MFKNKIVIQAQHPCFACTKLFVIALSAYNKAYPLRSRKDSLGLRHIAQKAAQRRVSKTLYAIAPCGMKYIYNTIEAKIYVKENMV